MADQMSPEETECARWFNAKRTEAPNAGAVVGVVTPGYMSPEVAPEAEESESKDTICYAFKPYHGPGGMDLNGSDLSSSDDDEDALVSSLTVSQRLRSSQVPQSCAAPAGKVSSCCSRLSGQQWIMYKATADEVKKVSGIQVKKEARKTEKSFYIYKLHQKEACFTKVDHVTPSLRKYSVWISQSGEKFRSLEALLRVLNK